MPRPRRDGSTPASPRKHKFTDSLIRKLKPQARPFAIWDLKQPGLAVLVQPSGHRAFKFVYSIKGRPRWYHIGTAAIPVADARGFAADVLRAVVAGKDPAADKKAERGGSTFAELAQAYVERHARKKNKSWAQADALVRKHLIPKWGKLQASAISRGDVKAAMAGIASPGVVNLTLASASAIFSWAIKEEVGSVTVNPCQRVNRMDMRSRERVLSDAEVPTFWKSFDDVFEGTLLKMILLTGQRPGEVRCMRTEHVVDGWWELPGLPDPSVGRMGTKNGATHRVWLPTAAQRLLAAQDAHGLVFEGARGRPMDRTRPASAMASICAELGVERATPHDLRRTHGTTITALGFGRDGMNRIQNHREGGIASVYDRHQYGDENKRIMEAVAARIMLLVDGGAVDNVVTAPFGRTAG